MYIPRKTYLAAIASPSLALICAIFMVARDAGATLYYINNTSTNGDVFTTAIGSDANDGLTAATPKLTLTNLLATYTMTGGVTVLIDTGTYSNYTVGVSATIATTPTNPVRFRGSTNAAAGGTVFNRASAAADGWLLTSVSNVVLSDFTVRGARDGIQLSAAQGVIIERVQANSNSRHGVYAFNNSHNTVVRNLIAAQNGDYAVHYQASTNCSLNSSVLWGNLGLRFRTSAAIAYISNSVIRSSGIGNYAVLREANVEGNHNVYVLEANAAAAGLIAGGATAIPRLSDVQQGYNTEWNSTVLDPLFANAASNDFHLLSEFGRFVNGSFTNDTVTSPLIDMGARTAAFSQETSPNGGRLNVGAYGNTVEASRSRTNRFLLALTHNDGGVISGTTGRIAWVAGNAATSDTVRLEYSLDGGSTWGIIATNVAATNEIATWNTTLHGSSGAAKWRVRYEAFPGIASTNVGFFSVRNTNILFYVNDASVTGDVYTTGPGNVTNLATAASPKDSLAHVIAAHTLSAGDTVYVDTGLYVLTNQLSFTYRERGLAGAPVEILGSTNNLAGGTVLDRANSLADTMLLSFAPSIHFRNLEFRNGRNGLLIQNSPELLLERVVVRDHSLTGVDIPSSSPNVAVRNSFFFNNLFRALSVGGTNLSLTGNTILGPRGITLQSSTTYIFENNIAVITNNAGAIFETVQGTPLTTPDYNLYWTENGAPIGRQGLTVYANFSEFQKIFNRDFRSAFRNPLFANSVAGDVHLASVAGRFTNGVFVNDAVMSPGVDLGNPASPFSRETAPNGGRLNVGFYGNSPEASRSRTNAWLLTLSYTDGGVLNVPGDSVYWNYGSFPSGATVRVELSTDSGTSWSTVQGGIAVTNGFYTWANTNFLSSRFAAWRVVYESDTNVLSATTSNFVFRNGPFVYYMNNEDTEGDIYTTAVGNDSNLGTSPGSPKYSLKSIVDTHPVQPGDIIYADSGVYTFGVNQLITTLDSGDTNDFIYIRGSTNDAVGGTVFQRGASSPVVYALHLNGSRFISLQDIHVRSSGYGLVLEGADGTRLRRVRSSGNAFAGIWSINSTNLNMQHVASWNNGEQGLHFQGVSRGSLQHAVLWQNGRDAIRIDGSGFLSFSNSSIYIGGSQAQAYFLQNVTNISANYNNLHLVSNAIVALVQSSGDLIDSMGRWSNDSGNDTFSLGVDARFASPSTGDFHLRSEAAQGRFLPGVGFVVDSETSLLIDAGAPQAPFTNEPAFNGGRVNIGYFGNTTQASKSVTNALLHAASLRDGGHVRGTSMLHWVAYNLPSNHPVRVSFSPDGGFTWVVLATNLPAGAESFAWNTTVHSNTPAALWRVSSETLTNLVDQTSRFFALRNSPLRLYLNDSSPAQDIYTTATGSPTNWVATPERPFHSLFQALEIFNLEPGDTVYLDTGTYVSGPMSIGRRQSGTTNQYVTFIGSTNGFTAGSVLAGTAKSPTNIILTAKEYRGLALSNLVFTAANTGLRLEEVNGFRAEFTRFHGLSNGAFFARSTNVLVQRSLFDRNDGIGIIRVGSPAETNRIFNSLFVSNGLAAIQQTDGRMMLEQSVIQAYGPNALGFLVQSNGFMVSDYNNIMTYDDASVARFGFSLSKTLSRWRDSTTNDLRSFSHEPLFNQPSSLDFHEQSPAGRYNPATGLFVTSDSQISPHIDGGNPSATFAGETAPNGERVNIGLFGNHPWASRSPTNARLYILTLNDGGSTRGTNTLQWQAMGSATGMVLTIDYSEDNGVTWTNIATNVPAAVGQQVWNTTLYPSSPLGRWRLTSQSQPSLSVTNERSFSLNNQPLAFYVNDASTAGDVYTTAIGDPLNDGIAEDSPLHSISAVLNRYDVQPGDRILVDTGFYSLTNSISLTLARISGVATNPIFITGSTNVAAGGTVLHRNKGLAVFELGQVSGITLQHLNLVDAVYGIRMIQSTNIVVEWVHARNMASGYELVGCDRVTFRHAAAMTSRTNGLANFNSTNTTWVSGVFWSNTTAVALEAAPPFFGLGPFAAQNRVNVSNSIIVAFGTNALAYRIDNGSLASDFNGIFLTNGALAARTTGEYYPILYENVSRWSRATSQDVFTITSDPLFQQPDEGDFHLRSEGGRYAPALNDFVFDAVSSPMIDAGPPTWSATNETAPNGSRINIGPHANTRFASRTPSLPLVHFLSFNDGGSASGVETLRWAARGNATNTPFRIEVSVDGGTNFTAIATNQSSATGVIAWNTLAHTSSAISVIRIIDPVTNSLIARTERFFAIRNTPLRFFVNDGSTTGDVYTTAAGSALFSGLTPAQPRPLLQDIFRLWDLEDGDVVYVDTGTYSNNAVIQISQLDSSTFGGTGFVHIVGSTNQAAGGSQMLGPSGAVGLFLSDASGVNLSHLRVAGANIGIRVWRSSRVQGEQLQTSGGSIGYEIDRSREVEWWRSSALGALEHGIYLANSSNIVWQNGLIWSNRFGLTVGFSTNFPVSSTERASLSVFNTAVGAFNANARFVNNLTLDARITSDFNHLTLTNGALVASLFITNPVPATRFIGALSEWAELTTNDLHSGTRPAFFANAGGGDFHPQSQAGRFNPATGSFTNDPVTSPLIDAGNPFSVFTNETSPNGFRINVGPNGNTFQASRTPSNSFLDVLSFNSGGRAAGTNNVFTWNARGNATGHLVRVELSVDGGLTWTNLATNVPATQQLLTWNSTAHLSTPIAQIRVTSQNEPGVAATNQQFFSIRNSPIGYYVNDSSLSGDMYTSAPGHPTNFGVAASAPLPTLQDVLSRWDLDAGDWVYVDTGVYTNNTDILITQLDAGGVSNLVKVVIVGSTNRAAGGTIIDRGTPGLNAGLSVSGAGGVQVRNLRVRNVAVGYSLENAEGIDLIGCEVHDVQTGVRAINSQNIRVERTAIRNASSHGLFLSAGGRYVIQSSILWSNQVGAYLSGLGPYAFSNSVVGAFGSDAYAYEIATVGALLSADYNNYFLTNGATMLLSSAETLENQSSLSRWVRWSGLDRNSMTKDPLFADAGAGDFHLQSEAGRYNPATGSYVIDTQSSPLIDAGGPSDTFATETTPNGERRNLGIHGDTSVASRSPTNPVLVVLALNDGGVAEGIKELTWLARGTVTGHTARLEYSSDGGSNWVGIASNVLARNQRFFWDTRSFASSIEGRWRIVSEVMTNVVGITDRNFALRNQPLRYYVNDPFTDGDIYTTAPGSSTNRGIRADAPANTVQRIIDEWELLPGDIVYVDTGTYVLTQPIEVGRYDAWSDFSLAGLAAGLTTNRMTIQGSSNVAFGGTTFLRFGTGDAFDINQAPGVALQNITILQGAAGVRFTESPYGLVQWGVRDGGQSGIVVDRSPNSRFERTVVRKTTSRALDVFRSTNTVWTHGIAWDNPVAFYQDGGQFEESSLTILNSIAGAFGSNAVVHFNISGQRVSDFNNFHLVNGAFAGYSLPRFNSVVTSRFETVSFWNKATGLDVHTMTVNPEFANVDSGDYHLKTTAPSGRYNAVTGQWTNDTTFSRLIDAGRPTDSANLEPTPNGSRIDIGLYGGTPEASRTPTNGWLTTLTLNDNGSVQGQVPLYWHAGGSATGDLVHVDFSPVGGLTWTNIATNVPASAGVVLWDTSLFGKSGAGKWRVVSQTTTSYYYISDGFIVMRDNTGVIPYFVNDLSTVGDVYTTAIGSSLNNGLLPSSPMRTVQQVINTYKLEPVDIIYIDTGVYNMTEEIALGDLDSGSGTNRITLQGSTNYAAGGSVMNRQVLQGSTVALRLENTSGITIRDLIFRGATDGIRVLSSEDLTFENVQSIENRDYGMFVDNANRIELLSYLGWRNGPTNGAGLFVKRSDVTLLNAQMEGNRYAIYNDDGSPTVIRNSMLSADADGGRIYLFGAESSIDAVAADYNNYRALGGSVIAEKINAAGGNDFYPYLYDWFTATGQDRHSLSHDARIVDATNRIYTLRSAAGRFLFNGTLTNDLVTSPLIDTGDPTTTVSNEVAPNGGRINIGLYGNTRFASLSPTNPWLQAITLNEGGVVGGVVDLYWTSGNMSNGARVRIEYSRNGGSEWLLLASNRLNNSESFLWDLSGEQVTSLAKWRIRDESNTNIIDETDGVFAIRNNSVVVYVNDASTTNDVYTTAPGSSANSGLSNNVPLASISEALERFPLGPGDIIYVDTGIYSVSNSIVMNEFINGSSNAPITILGSTNRLAGSRLEFGSQRAGLSFENTKNWRVQNLTIAGASNGVSIVNSIGVTLLDVRSTLCSDSGFYLQRASDVVAERCISDNNAGWAASIISASELSWSGGIAYSNRSGGFALAGSSMELRNSIVHAFHPTSFIYQVNQSSVDGSDYNFFWIGTNAALARDDQFKFVFANLSEWQQQQGVDYHSVIGDPLFSNPSAGDFSLRSSAGRYSLSGLLVLGDTTNSWAIDAGDPASTFALEPAPNGARRNLGHQGNTTLASHSPTNLANQALLAVSYNDGGQATGLVELYWLSRAFSPTGTVRVEYTLDNGLSWHVVASNTPISQGSVLWDTTSLPSSPLAAWRVISEANPAVSDTLDTTFILRNGPILFYVNDTNTLGDIYTTAIGSSTNDGLVPSRPKSVVNDIFERYNIDGGDTIYVDTGFYLLTNSTYIGILDSGSATNLVYILGSTNGAAGGTRLAPMPPPLDTNSTLVVTNDAAFRFTGASGVSVANFITDNFKDGIRFELFAFGNIASNMLIRGSEFGGVAFSLASDNIIDRSVITRGLRNGINMSVSGDNKIRNSIIWSNSGSAVVMSLSDASFTNCVLHAYSTNTIYLIQTNSIVYGDYNNLYAEAPAAYAQFNGVPYEGLPQWTFATFQELFSVSANPRFADAASDDYHEQSFIGRYDPSISSFVTVDTNLSVNIDTGVLEWNFGEETLPNGSRVNIGLYANSPEASRSRTNAWILPITGMAGGRMEGSLLLTWAYGNIDEFEPVKLDYSFNDGVTWTNIGTSVVSALTFLWQSDQKFPGNIERWPSSPIARWRISLLSDTNLFGITENYFSLRNKKFAFYVNDASTVGDVFTCGPGDDNNLGIFPCEPKATLKSLLQTLDIEGDDTILIDTGTYVFDTNVVEIGTSDQGNATFQAIYRGNPDGVSTVLEQPVGPGMPAFSLDVKGAYIRLEDLRFRRGGIRTAGTVQLTDLRMTNAGIQVFGPNVLIEQVSMHGAELSVAGSACLATDIIVQNGSVKLSGTNVVLQNSLVFGSNTADAVEANGVNIQLVNNTLYTKGSAVVQTGNGGSSVRNSILVADGRDLFCLDIRGGTLVSDHNTFWPRNGAWIGGYKNGNWEKLLYWQREAQQDLHSIAADPAFVNVASNDFRLKSVVGRWNGTSFVVDSVHSPSIDSGDPQDDPSLEPFPNGGVINHGYDGNRSLASMSRTNAWLMALTMNDGGVFKGTNVLAWRTGNISATNTVRLEYSANGGASWTTIVSGVNAVQSNYVWNSTLFPSSLDASWRLVLLEDTNVVDAVDNLFALRNSSVNFYVNDTSTSGDVYTVSIGNDANDGRTPSSPKRTLAQLLETYDTEGGDVIYVDTGSYPILDLNRVIWSRGGDASSGPLVIQGSTNLAAGGSVLSRSSSIPGNHVLEVPASHVTVRDLTLQGGFHGFTASSNTSLVVEGVFVRSNQFGVFLNNSFDVNLRNLRVWNNRQGGIDVLSGRTTILENATFVANSNFSYRLEGSVGDVIQNNIFYISYTNTAALSGLTSAVYNATIDYNVYFFAQPGSFIYGNYQALLPWQLDRQKDYRSAITNPLLNNVESGDFHLQSQFGRYDAGTFVTDPVSSWAIDRGNPASAFSNETAFNGGRVNIGAFGNTPFASRSSTNRILETRVLNSPTQISDTNGTIPLIWGAVNLPTNLIVNVQYSGDGGLTWTNIQAGVDADQEVYVWQATPSFNSFKGYWRVIGQDGTNVYVASNAAPITVFFGQFRISEITKSPPNNRNNIVWRGAWNEFYQVQQSDDGFSWSNSFSGLATNQQAFFLTTRGGDFLYQDATSTNATLPDRLYRVLWLQY